LYEFIQKLAKKIVSRLGFQPGTNIALAIITVSAIHRPASSVSGHFIYIPYNQENHPKNEIVLYPTIKKTIRKTRLYKFIRVA